MKFAPVAVCVAAVIAVSAAPSQAATASASGLGPVKHVQVGKISVGYRTGGSGPPLVLIPGFALTMAEWDPALLQELSEHHRVIVFDNRGVATSSDSPGNRLTIEQMADDTNGLIKKLGFKSVHVLGWSMGGYIAQELVLRHPASVRRLVLAATDPGGPKAVQPSAKVLAILTNPNSTQDEFLTILFPPNELSAGGRWYRRIGMETDLTPDSFTITPEIIEKQTIAS
jgi:pimeloyl-ACP methyl ester carboxylesterase